MNVSFYRTRRAFRKAAIPAVLLAAACAPRAAKVDDAKLAGVPAERLEGVAGAKKELTETRAAFERAKDEVAEADFKVRIARAALRVAEARAAQHDEEFALAKFRNVNADILGAAEAQRGGQNLVRRAKADVDVAEAEQEAQKRKSAELERRVRWIEAKHEYERAKVALRYDQGSPNEKSAQLNQYEQAELSAQLAWKEAEGAWRQAVLKLDDAKQVRKALEALQ